MLIDTDRKFIYSSCLPVFFFTIVHLPCYFCQYGTKIKETFCNKTVKICDEDKPNCLSYNFFYRNNTRVFGIGCGGDNDCKNTSKTCEDFVKKNQDVSTCTMSCCEEPRCNRGSVQLTHHLLTFILVFFFSLALF